MFGNNELKRSPHIGTLELKYISVYLPRPDVGRHAGLHTTAGCIQRYAVTPEGWTGVSQGSRSQIMAWEHSP